MTLGRAGRVVLPLVVGAAAARVAGELGSFALASQRLPQWDPAGYGVAGARLADAVRAVEPLTFLHELNRSGLWPPLFPLAETPVFLAFGPGYRVAGALLAALVLLTAMAAYWAGRWLVLACRVAARRSPAGGRDPEDRASARRTATARLDPPAAGVAGALTALLVLASPFVHLFGTLVMLEVPGALLVFAAVGTYARALASHRLRHWRWACAAATALFFLKYNYGLLWLVPLALSELWLAAERSGESPLRLARRWLGSRLRSADLAAPWTWFVALYLAGLALLVVGEWGVRLAGREVGARSIGNPLYALYLLFAIRHLAWPRRRRELLARYRRLGERGRTAVRWIVLPIAVWMALPPHMKDFFKFVVNRSSGVPLWSVDRLAFYPGVFVADYSPHPAVGIAVLLLAAGSLAGLPRLPPARRALGIALLVGSLAAFLHPYQLPRFLFTLAPLVWLSAAATVAAGLGAARARADRRLHPDSGSPPRGPRRALAGAVAALPGFAAVALWVWGAWIAITGGVDRARLAQAHEVRSVPAAVTPLLDAIADAAVAAGGSAVVGIWNDLSPGLVEWHCRIRHPGLAAAAIPRDAARLGSKANPLAILDRAADPTSRLVRLLVVDAIGEGPRSTAIFAAETGWADPIRRRLTTDPRFTREAELPFPEAGYRLRVYRVAADAGR